MSNSAEPTLFYLPYESFLADVESLARKLEADEWKPDFLVGIGRGGLVPAAYLSHRLNHAMLSVDISSGEAGFAAELLVKLAAKIGDGRRILIVDDINDSGSTIATLRAGIEAHIGCGDQLRFAVLIDNIRSRVRVEYSAGVIDRAEDKRWFVFPWEAVAKPAELLIEAVSVPERLA